MAKTIKRYFNCIPTGVDYTGAEDTSITNGTEGIMKITVTNPKRQLEPMKEYIVNVQPGQVATVPAGLKDREGTAITANSEIVVIVEGSTVPTTVVV